MNTRSVSVTISGVGESADAVELLERHLPEGAIAHTYPRDSGLIVVVCGYPAELTGAFGAIQRALSDVCQALEAAQLQPPAKLGIELL